MPWVTLRETKDVRRGGVLRNYLPGDSVEVGRQTAIEWILDGSAEDPFGQIGPPLNYNQRSKEYGIRIRGHEGQEDLTPLGDMAHRVELSYGPPAVPYKYTFIWKPGKIVSSKLINYGFVRILDGWEMAAALVSLKCLAGDIGTADEQALTKRTIGDLRLPVYESRLLWARKCPAAMAVVEEWARELEKGADEFHSFLRALYTQRAMISTLPVDWVHR